MIPATYRLTKGLQALFTTPPPVGTLCLLWRNDGVNCWLDGEAEDSPAEFLFRVPVEMMVTHFKAVDGTSKEAIRRRQKRERREAE